MASVDRIKRQTTATISNTWYSGGTVADPGTVTIGITRADGSTVVAAGTATTGSGSAARTFNLTTSHTSLLDILTATWTSSTLGSDTTLHEIVGDFLFSESDIRAAPYGLAAVDYPTSLVTDARTLAEEAIEDACGVAFVPRFRREVVSGTGGTVLLLGVPRVTSIRSATVDGTALTAPQLAALTYSAIGTVNYADAWSVGINNVAVAYEHGHSRPPALISRACLLLAKHYLTETPFDDRYTSVSTEDGTFSLATPGVRGSTFGIPEVDAAVNQYAMRALAI